MAAQLSKEDNKHYVIKFLKVQLTITGTELIPVTLVVFYTSF